MEAYTDFAKIYDALTFDVDYDAWCDRLEELFKSFGKKPEIVCELGCGTGSITSRLAKRGYSMIGIDLSPEMLDVAREKCCGTDTLLLNQDMTDFELYGTVDVVICTLDGVNYLTEDGDIEKMLDCCKLYLNPGGLLIFDINTEYKIRNVIAPETFVYETEDVFYTWQSELDEDICDYYLTFFVKCGENYKRFDEVHSERIYKDEFLLSALKSRGFEVFGHFDGLTGAAPHEDTLRIMYAAKKNCEFLKLGVDKSQKV